MNTPHVATVDVKPTQSNFSKIKNDIIRFFDHLVNGKEPKSLHFDIVFGPDAAVYGEHGRIVGTWLKEGHPREITISFFVVGYNVPPRLDQCLMEEIYSHAAMKGIMMSHLSGYASVSVVNAPASKPRSNYIKQ